MRTVSLMGSTGSIGTQALDVLRSETSMNSHADKALALLKARPAA